jgi:hypothetical protein
VRRVILVLILAIDSKIDDSGFLKMNRYAQSNPNRWLFDKWLRVARQTRVTAQWLAGGAMGKAHRRGANFSYRVPIAMVLGLKR